MIGGVRALAGVTSVSVEHREQAQVILVQSSRGRRADAAAPGELDGAGSAGSSRASRRSRTPTSSWSRTRDGILLNGAAARVAPGCRTSRCSRATALSIDDGRSDAARLRDDRVLPLFGTEHRGDAPQRLPRRHGDGDLVAVWIGAGGAIQHQRGLGTLELLVASRSVLRPCSRRSPSRSRRSGIYSLARRSRGDGSCSGSRLARAPARCS